MYTTFGIGSAALFAGVGSVIGAIVHDIRSGSRRRRLSASAPEVRLDPSGLSLSGSF